LVVDLSQTEPLCDRSEAAMAAAAWSSAGERFRVEGLDEDRLVLVAVGHDPMM
jgi:hypothetical protein